MEKIQITQITGTYNYKIIIPVEVEQKIRYICQKIWNTEWSGTLFYTYEGSFEHNNLIIKCVDFYVMDIGSTIYTEFNMNPNIVSYMSDNPELLNCQIGLIHSHHNMATFFSDTDIDTLREEGNNSNNFVSLVVNNAGSYSAAITRKVINKEIKECKTYEFFGEGKKSSIENTTIETPSIEWFKLKIEKKENNQYSDIDNRLEGLKKEKELMGIKNIALNHKSILTSEVSQNYSNNYSIQNDNLYNETFEVNPKILESLTIQLISSSILITNKTKEEFDKWVKAMPVIYEKRFGKGASGIASFKIWAEWYVEYLTWNIQDEDLLIAGLDQSEIQSVYANSLIDVLRKFPENIYIKVYIEELDKYIYNE